MKERQINVLKDELTNRYIDILIDKQINGWKKGK